MHPRGRLTPGWSLFAHMQEAAAELMTRMKDPQDWQAPFWASMPRRNESLGIFSFPPEYIETLQAPGLVGRGSKLLQQGRAGKEGHLAAGEGLARRDTLQQSRGGAGRKAHLAARLGLACRSHQPNLYRQRCCRHLGRYGPPCSMRSQQPMCLSVPCIHPSPVSGLLLRRPGATWLN
jgi:hypothetical protein